MSDGWLAARPAPRRIGLRDWPRVLWRSALLLPVVFGGLAVLALLRLLEAPLFRTRRPVTPWVTQGLCRLALRVLRVRLEVTGRPMTRPGASVANHAGWLDILVLNAAHRVYFVAKSEVAGWRVIGWLARITGTVFIARKPAEAQKQQVLLARHLRAGHRILFFPEGTSTDSLRILKFKSTLFSAFFVPELGLPQYVQPVTVVYHVPEGEDPRHYAWWANMNFLGHLLRLVTTPGPGRAEVIFHPEVAVADFADRKLLSRHAEAAVRSAHPAG